MSAINIPDMIQIVKEHGLVPVPLDLNLDKMEPLGLDALKAVVNSKVRYILPLTLNNRQKLAYLHTCMVLDTIFPSIWSI